jgi:hypothetical protein
MGLEASCTAAFGAARGEGHALLETAELVFRGPFRLKIPFASIRRVTAARGILTVAFVDSNSTPLGTGVATFALGKAADTWALKIRHPRPLIDKIGVLPGMRVRIVGSHAGVGDETFWRDFRARVDDRARARRAIPRPFGQLRVVPSKVEGRAPERERAGVGPPERVSHDVVLLFVRGVPALDRLGELRGEIARNGSIWVVYPKGVQVIREGDVRSAGRRHGLVDVKIASFDDRYSSMKFVIPVARRKPAPEASPTKGTKR